MVYLDDLYRSRWDRQRPLLIAVYLLWWNSSLSFQVHAHSELRTTWRWHTAYLFTPKQCVVFEVVGCRRTYLDVVIRPHGGRTGVAPFEL